LIAMRFGLNFPLAGPLSDASVVAQLAREAEDAGWDGCFVWDHLLLAGAPPLADPWIALALIAQATSRIRLGPLVTPLFRRNPAKPSFATHPDSYTDPWEEVAAALIKLLPHLKEPMDWVAGE
jgi:Luciferase-like monooxygenase